MGDYFTDILLVLSVIAAPIIFGVLLYYGITMKEHRHHEAELAAERDRKPQGRAAPRKLYDAPEAESPAANTKAVQPDRPIDVVKNSTGTSP